MRSFLSKSIKHIRRNLLIWQGVMEDDAFQTVTKGRVLTLSGAAFFCFTLVGVRLTDLMIVERRSPHAWHVQQRAVDGGVPRADILDRNGVVLATHLVTASAYCDTRDLLDVDEAIDALARVLPEISRETISRKLRSGKSFVWIARHVTPKRQEAIQRLGLPGIYFKKDYKRVYPLGHLASHVVGFCNPDSEGLSGVEHCFDALLASSNDPLRLSLDVRVQHVAVELLGAAVEEFHAEGGNVIVMNARSGEILAMTSLPDFNPNAAKDAKVKDFFNRNTLGVYEMGSVLKVLNVAIALETGRVTRHSMFDVREPVKIGRFTVTDFRGQNRILNLEEAFLYSSNIAAIKIAQQFGGAEVQQKFFKAFGVFDPVNLEVPERGRPLYAQNWTSATAMSAAYGYGVAISPVRLLSTINGITNGGILVEPTLVCGKKTERRLILTANTSHQVRSMMRRVIAEGTARRADAKGYRVFGKTGTAYKNKEGRYDPNKERRTVFVGGFPEEDPQFIVLFMLDAPKATKKTFGYATAGWNVTPYAGQLIERIAPLLGVTVRNAHQLPQKKTSAPVPSASSHYLYRNINQMFSSPSHQN